MGSPTRTPITRKQLEQVFKDPQTLLAFEQVVQTFTNVQNGSLTFSSGDLKPFAGSIAPDGWLLCNGQAVSRTLYSALFGVIGTSFGAGDGSTTFNVPDFRGAVPVGASGTIPLGSTGGAASVVLTVNQLPAHSHTVTDPGHGHGVTDPGHLHSGGNNTVGGTGVVGTSTPAGNTGTSTTGITVNSGPSNITIQNTGNGAAVPTMPPYAAITWLIKA